ncbi:MAG: PilZ domain-containing protein, partial [Phycisphaeraceae bacterium]
MTATSSSEHREHPRHPLPAMYTHVRVRAEGEVGFTRAGYIYDVSLSGMRFELDQALAPGTAIEARCMLPGQAHVFFSVAGRVVRQHDEEDTTFGPTRLGMRFEAFHRSTDRMRLEAYLNEAMAVSAAR